MTKTATKFRTVTSTTSAIAGRSRRDLLQGRDEVVAAPQEEPPDFEPNDAVPDLEDVDEAPIELFARGVVYCATAPPNVKLIKPAASFKPPKGRAVCARRVTKTRYLKSRTVKKTKTATRTSWVTVTVPAVG